MKVERIVNTVIYGLILWIGFYSGSQWRRLATMVTHEKLAMEVKCDYCHLNNGRVRVELRTELRR
jgi:hypothetical protein